MRSRFVKGCEKKTCVWREHTDCIPCSIISPSPFDATKYNEVLLTNTSIFVLAITTTLESAQRARRDHHYRSLSFARSLDMCALVSYVGCPKSASTSSSSVWSSRGIPGIEDSYFAQTQMAHQTRSPQRTCFVKCFCLGSLGLCCTKK